MFIDFPLQEACNLEGFVYTWKVKYKPSQSMLQVLEIRAVNCGPLTHNDSYSVRECTYIQTIFELRISNCE